MGEEAHRVNVAERHQLLVPLQGLEFLKQHLGGAAAVSTAAPIPLGRQGPRSNPAGAGFRAFSAGSHLARRGLEEWLGKSHVGANIVGVIPHVENL